MPRILINFLFAAMVSPLVSLSQEKSADSNELSLTNIQTIDPKRYDEVKGSPYYFDDFVIGNVVSTDLEVIKDIEVNYNGLTGEIEVRKDKAFIELDKKFYVRIEIYPHQNPDLNLTYPIIFQRDFERDGSHGYSIMIYEGENIKVAKEFKATITERVIQNVGETIRQKRFVADNSYFLIQSGESVGVKLKKKKILAELNHQDKIADYLKETELDIETEEGLRKFLRFYETLE